MSVHSCEKGGLPGYQGRPDGECYTFEPWDDDGRSAALRAAARDQLAYNAEQQQPATGT